MKIVFNTDQIYLHGGIERVMATKANYFINQPNTEVYIVTTEQKNKPPRYLLDNRTTLVDLGINYNREISYYSWENIKKVFKHYRKQKRLFKEIKPDVIISPNFNFDFYWLPFIQKKAKKIKEIHASRYNWKPTFFNRLNAWIERKYDSIVVLNKDEASYFTSNNVVVIPNPIEIQNLTASLDKKQVMAAGRIAPVKGFDQLIEAWEIVFQQHPDWQLHIYGPDYLNTQKQLQQLINKKGLEQVVLFKGNGDNIPQTMLDYSIYAMSSITECFPMVLLEALSVGLPIVSYDCPNGPRNIIENGQSGILVEQGNNKSLSDHLIRLIDNKELRKQIGEKAKERSYLFSTEKIMNLWFSLLIK